MEKIEKMRQMIDKFYDLYEMIIWKSNFVTQTFYRFSLAINAGKKLNFFCTHVTPNDNLAWRQSSGWKCKKHNLFEILENRVWTLF